MKIVRADAANTQKNLLAAAGEVFARSGYHDATIAEICDRAGANLAAVNYHFGDKENLYREAWRHAFRESLVRHPPDGGISDDGVPEECLRGAVTALLRRAADENNQSFLIAYKELANPTGLLQEVMAEAIQPLHLRMETLIRRLLGQDAPDIVVQFCAISIVSQCVSPILMNRLEKDRQEGKDGLPRVDDIEVYAAHVVKFSLAGIQANRHGVERGRRRSKT
jgi:AcrR family transcriptional regulator